MKNCQKMAAAGAIALALVMLTQATTAYAVPLSAGLSSAALADAEETLAEEAEPEKVEPHFAPIIDFERLGKAMTPIPVATAASIREELRERSLMTKTELSEIKEADNGLIGSLGIVNVNLSLNVRVSPSADADVVGKLYQNAGVIIGNFAGADNEWVYITSGAVRGWVISKYIVTGELTGSFYEALNPYVGTIVTTDVKVYKAADTDADVLVEVDLDSYYPVVDYEGDFVKIQVSANDFGYVHSEYIAVSAGLCVGVKVLDDYAIQDRIDELYEKRRAKREAEAEAARKEAREAAEKKTGPQSSKNGGENRKSSRSTDDSGIGEGWRHVGKFTITAYCVNCNTPKGSRATYSGAKAKEWYTAAINMNGSDLSIGDTVKISGYGTFKIQDVGGSPYGRNWIDIFVYPEECNSTFRRNVDVWVKN